MIVRQAGDETLGGKLDRHEARQPERRPHDGGVDEVVAQSGRRIGEVELLGLDGCAGLPFAVGAQQLRDYLEPGADRVAQLQRLLRRAAHAAHRLDGRVKFGEDLAGQAGEHPARRGHLHGARGPAQQRDVQSPLEITDGVTHPGSGDGQALGRAAEVTFVGDSEERFELPQRDILHRYPRYPRYLIMSYVKTMLALIRPSPWGFVSVAWRKRKQ